MAEQLVNEGYVNVRVLDGGVDAWREAGYPMAGERDPLGPHVGM